MPCPSWSCPPVFRARTPSSPDSGSSRTFARRWAANRRAAMRTCTILLVLLSAAATLSAESAAGLRWMAPMGWKSEDPQPLRVATYTIVATTGDHDNAECAVYFFGAGQGGTVQANVERWKSQFHGPDGKQATARVAMRTIHGLAVTTIDTSGAYSGLGGPVASGPTKAGYRLLGAIVEGPGGSVFLKFTGPSKTMAANQAKFEQLLGSFQKAQ